jgi:purine-nucleoside phosphorylase
MALAQALLQAPRMANHSRGLWGYTGMTTAGGELTIQSTGIGGPSAVVVLEELAGLGVRRAIRIGTCIALDGSLDLGELVVVSAAIAADGASRALGAEANAAPDPRLHAALREAAAGAPATEARVASTHHFYDPLAVERRAAWLDTGARAVDLGTAPLFTLGRNREIAAACCLVVSELAHGERLDDASLEAAVLRAGELGAEALGI